MVFRSLTGFVVSAPGFGFPEKKGCVDFCVFETGLAFCVFACDTGGSAASGRICSLPSKIWVIFSPMRLRSASSWPYLIQTTLVVSFERFGFGGDPRVPVLVLNRNTLAGALLIGGVSFALLGGLVSATAGIGEALTETVEASV